MEKVSRLFLLFALTVLLNGCNTWDDMVDSVTGSGDDDPAPVTSAVVSTQASSAPEEATVEANTGATDPYNSSERVTLNYHAAHKLHYSWLSQTGSYYGGKIEFEFVDCGQTLTVENAADNYLPNGHAGPNYFCGTKNKPEESNGDKASIFGPPSCTSSQTMTAILHYNK